MSILKRYLPAIATGAALMVPAYAQTAERRATFAGNGGITGKCAIEVYVDGSAEVEIRGDRGRLRTLNGQPAQWRRFVCTGPMPANPGEFRFIGVDGRGRQELVQSPANGGGAALVRIDDSNGGAEGYTFDLVWRTSGFVAPQPPALTFPLTIGRDRGASPDFALRACQDVVRERAVQQYSLRDVEFARANIEDNPGRNDRISGSFNARRDNNGETFGFSCELDLASGRVRTADITEGRRPAISDRNADPENTGRREATSACRRAIEQRIQRDGYQNVRIGLLQIDNRRADWIGGTATAQRGDYGRPFDFDIGCTVNRRDGDIQSVQANRR
jgi:hypothetical protein